MGVREPAERCHAEWLAYWLDNFLRERIYYGKPDKETGERATGIRSQIWPMQRVDTFKRVIEQLKKECTCAKEGE